jgi:hypothetical protein
MNTRRDITSCDRLERSRDKRRRALPSWGNALHVGMPRGRARYRFNIRKGCLRLYRSCREEVQMIIQGLATEIGQEKQHEEGEKEEVCNLTHRQQGQSNLFCCPVKDVRKSALV